MPAVSNSSPLILYAAVGRLGLLREIYDEIAVPPAVWREVVAAGAGRAGASEVRQASWIRRRQPSAHVIAPLGLADLDDGEAEAIALALSIEPRIPIILDDLRARGVAKEANLVVTGTGGVLVQAKRMGLVSSIRPLLSELRSAGLYLSEAAAGRFLTLAGEL